MRGATGFWSNFGSDLLALRVQNPEINRIASTLQTKPREASTVFGVPLKLEPLRPTPEVAERMRRVATRDTEPERRVRKIVRQVGIRHTSRTSHLPGKPDLVLPDYGIAVFVHGCFWHGCPRCYVEPKRNRQWWRQKIANNRRRDRRKADQLRRLGYSVITLMEHDDDRRISARLEKICKWYVERRFSTQAW